MLQVPAATASSNRMAPPARRGKKVLPIELCKSVCLVFSITVWLLLACASAQPPPLVAGEHTALASHQLESSTGPVETPTKDGHQQEMLSNGTISSQHPQKPEPMAQATLENEGQYTGQLLRSLRQQQQQQQQQEQQARATASYMRRHMLEDKQSNVTCNDGTRAGYYIRQNEHSKRWLIFLEGGWHCFNGKSCQQRWLRMRHLMTSAHWPELKNGVGILSSNPDENPYWWNANHVFIPYCSSDSWSGDYVSKSPGEFSFMGSRIIDEVIKSLLNRENGLGQGRFVLFAGSSAGAAGVIVNLDRVSNMIHAHIDNKAATGSEGNASPTRGHEIEVRGLADSGWFLDNEPFDYLENQTPSLRAPDSIVPNSASKLKKSISSANPAAQSTPSAASTTLSLATDSTPSPSQYHHQSRSTSPDQYSALRSATASTQQQQDAIHQRHQPSSATGIGIQASQAVPLARTSINNNNNNNNNGGGDVHDEQPCDEPHACAPIQSIKLAMRMWNGRVPEACRDQYPDEVWRCYFGYRAYATLKTPLFVVQWLFDEAQLMVDNVGQPVTTSQWNYIHRMSAQIRATLESVPAVFAPSCFSHIILTKRDWFQIKVNGLSLAQALNYWEAQKVPQRTLSSFNQTNNETKNANQSTINRFNSNHVDNNRSPSYHNHHPSMLSPPQQAYYSSGELSQYTQPQVPQSQSDSSNSNNLFFNNNKLSQIIQSETGSPNYGHHAQQAQQPRRGKKKNKKRNNKNSRNNKNHNHNNNNYSGNNNSSNTHLNLLLNNNVRNAQSDLSLDHLINRNENLRQKRDATDSMLANSGPRYERRRPMNRRSGDELNSSRNTKDSVHQSTSIDSNTNLWLVDSCTWPQCNQECPSLQNVYPGDFWNQDEQIFTVSSIRLR